MPNTESETPVLTSDEKLDLLLKNFATFDNKITAIGSRLDSIESSVSVHSSSLQRIDRALISDNTRIKTLEDTSAGHTSLINEVKDSAKFLSDEYESMKLKLASINTLQSENVHLKKQIDDLENDVLQEKIARNGEQQYLRTSLNIKLCGVPSQPGEDIQTKTASNPVTLDVIKQVALQSDMHLPPSSIDVCHRLSDDPTAPIIIRFISKSSRFNFVAQKEKLKNITSADIDLSGIQIPKQLLSERKDGHRGGSRGGRNGGATTRNGGIGEAVANEFSGGFGSPTHIYLQEHLTKRNKDLLKEAKSTLHETFEFPGYVYHGEIRAKRNKTSKHHVIKSKADIQTLLKLPRNPND